MKNNILFSYELIYVLELENKYFWIGYTSNLNMRLASLYGLNDNTDLNSSDWVKMHKPIKISEVVIGTREEINKITIKYINIYGNDKVRNSNHKTKSKTKSKIKNETKTETELVEVP